MKCIVKLISLLSFFCGFSQSNSDSVSISTQITELRKAIDSLSKTIKSHEDEKDTAAIVCLKRTADILVYNNDQEATDTIQIREIVFDIRDGLILDIQVIDNDNRVFTNYWAPIAITRFNNTCSWLTSRYLVPDPKSKIHQVKPEYRYVHTCDFLNIVRKGVAVPDNVTFTFYKQGDKKILTRGAGINQVVDLRIFTDMFAALGSEPNGLAQIEGSSRIFINNKNWFKRSTTPFRYGYFLLQASKLDSKFQFTELDSSFTRLKAIQRNTVSAEIGLNLIGSWLQTKSRSWASLNGGAGLHLVRLKNMQDTTLVSSQFLFLETLFEFKELNNFGLDFNGRVLWQKFSGLTDELSMLQPILRLGVTAYWNPVNNHSSRIFFRTNYFQEMNGGNNPFVQIQIGYSAVVSSLITKEKSKN
ncbi:MAG: hypothetical protein KF763_05305 [Cyclobacteriaceae bacterium]|nr:hypothetical protein [Cyclobacteriaceae bacterium]